MLGGLHKYHKEVNHEMTKMTAWIFAEREPGSYIWLALMAPLTAAEAACLVADCTPGLLATDLANSAWAFSKLAPVLRYRECTYQKVTVCIRSLKNQLLLESEHK